MTISKYKRRGIGVFRQKLDAQAAMNDLKDSGFPMEKVSVIVKEDGNQSIKGKDLTKKPGHPVSEGVKVGSVTGTTIGLLTGLLAGISTVTIPGIGPVVVAGNIAEAIAVALAAGGAGAISGGLIGTLAALGIPGKRAQVYSELLSQGDYLLVIEGTSDELMRAEMILLNDKGIVEWSIFDGHDKDVAISESS